jgi:formylglycine-generating enzyme required for sulfatase activity
MNKLITIIVVMTIVLIILSSCNIQPGISIIAGFEMIGVEGGTFVMGDSLDEGRPDEKPLHSVTLSDFYIGKNEVTQKQFYDVMGFLPQNLIYGQGDNYPVYNLCWLDIQRFLKKLNKKTGKKFRLPTEAEWEYACRGGKYSDNYKYSGSDTISIVAWYCMNSCDEQLTDEEYSYPFLKEKNCTTQPVGTLQPNELGIYDMSGNVREWCDDLFIEYPSSPQKNPITKKRGNVHVIRGGGFDNASLLCRTTNRDKGPNYSFSFNLGFRLAHSK